MCISLYICQLMNWNNFCVDVFLFFTQLCSSAVIQYSAFTKKNVLSVLNIVTNATFLRSLKAFTNMGIFLPCQFACQYIFWTILFELTSTNHVVSVLMRIKNNTGALSSETRWHKLLLSVSTKATHARSTPSGLTFHNTSPRHMHCLSFYQRVLKFPERTLNDIVCRKIGYIITYLRWIARHYSGSIGSW